MRKLLSLLSPKIIEYDKETTFFAEMSIGKTIYYDEGIGVSTPIIFDVVGLGKNKDDAIIEKAENDVKHLLDEKVAKLMYVLNSKVVYCSSHLGLSSPFRPKIK